MVRKSRRLNGGGSILAALDVACNTVAKPVAETKPKKKKKTPKKKKKPATKALASPPPEITSPLASDWSAHAGNDSTPPPSSKKESASRSTKLASPPPSSVVVSKQLTFASPSDSAVSEALSELSGGLASPLQMDSDDCSGEEGGDEFSEDSSSDEEDSCASSASECEFEWNSTSERRQEQRDEVEEEDYVDDQGDFINDDEDDSDEYQDSSGDDEEEDVLEFDDEEERMKKLRASKKKETVVKETTSKKSTKNMVTEDDREADPEEDQGDGAPTESVATENDDEVEALVEILDDTHIHNSAEVEAVVELAEQQSGDDAPDDDDETEDEVTDDEEEVLAYNEDPDEEPTNSDDSDDALVFDEEESVSSTHLPNELKPKKNTSEDDLAEEGPQSPTLEIASEQQEDDVAAPDEAPHESGQDISNENVLDDPVDAIRQDILKEDELDESMENTAVDAGESLVELASDNDLEPADDESVIAEKEAVRDEDKEATKRSVFDESMEKEPDDDVSEAFDEVTEEEVGRMDDSEPEDNDSLLVTFDESVETELSLADGSKPVEQGILALGALAEKETVGVYDSELVEKVNHHDSEPKGNDSLLKVAVDGPAEKEVSSIGGSVPLEEDTHSLSISDHDSVDKEPVVNELIPFADSEAGAAKQEDKPVEETDSIARNRIISTNNDEDEEISPLNLAEVEEVTDQTASEPIAEEVMPLNQSVDELAAMLDNMPNGPVEVDTASLNESVDMAATLDDALNNSIENQTLPVNESVNDGSYLTAAFYNARDESVDQKPADLNNSIGMATALDDVLNESVEQEAVASLNDDLANAFDDEPMLPQIHAAPIEFDELVGQLNLDDTESVAPIVAATVGEDGKLASKSVEEEPVPPLVKLENQGLAEKKVKRLKQYKREGSIKKGKWSLGSKIGTGSFGVVHVGMNTSTGQLMAVKSVELCPPAMKDVRMEVEVLKSLKHVNIVGYLGAERAGNKLHIFQEWVPGGSVTTLLHKFGPFASGVIRSYLSQILTGLSYLHDNRILHRDIKGGNVLVTDDGIVKLADFGAAKRLAHQQSDLMESLTMRGTPYFMAPEVFEEHYNGKADIWSVGCVAFQMATGVPPWKTEGFTNPMSLFLHLQKSEGLPLLEWSEKSSMGKEERQPFVSLLEKCFSRDPKQRPTAQGLAANSFFHAPSSSEDDYSLASRGLFSPGADSISTFAVTVAQSQLPATTPGCKGTPPVSRTAFMSPPVRSSVRRSTSSPSLLSPPVPRSVRRASGTQNMSPLPFSSDTKEWPSWARKTLKNQMTSPIQRPSPKASPLMDSLAFSEDTKNPFARSCRSPLEGLNFVESNSFKG